ncbi:MAG: protein phosphatase 2C domain-containing protein [Hyphomonadaceae bacterium]|nr:protein phosphatase 2C domain-containing protein [Hyphomonadaceae bacterium]
MLTVVETISLAGDRREQNDDTCGVGVRAAWVIDGATDLHDEPASGAASDAAWIAQGLNRFLTSGVRDHSEAALRATLAAASRALKQAFPLPAGAPGWISPLCSMLFVAETADGIAGIDLGDSRCFARDAASAHEAGGPVGAADRESAFAAKIAQSSPTQSAALYRAPEAISVLRELRAKQNETPEAAVFTLDPRCAEHARFWTIPLARPAHILIATDGFSALVDRYGAYDAGGLVEAALERGLQELGRELRAIEADDSGGAKHPRWKRCDDATAILLRLT